MRPGSLALLAVVALSLAVPLPQASACAAGSAQVPCGYVYPRLLFDLGERGVPLTLTGAAPAVLEGALTFTWDISAEGLAVPNPTAPIVVTFDFPRKPEWLALEVEPAQLEIPISPQYVETQDTTAGTTLVYRYTTPITVTARLTGTPLVDPALPPSMLILAQSSESGLYKPGFGVRDVPLDLPEAQVQPSSAARPGAELRIGAPEPLALPPLALEFEGATLSLHADAPVELWRPSRLVARVERGGEAAKAVDLAASVVDERNAILYTTGLRHAPEGALPFDFTFPAPGQYRVHLAARPLPGASDLGIDPLVATFDVTLPGVGYDALRYPDSYRAAYVEPIAEAHANTADLPRQFEKLLRFPVLPGADSASVQVRLGSTVGAALGAGSVYAEVLSPSEEQVAFGKLDAVTPGMDARLRGPLLPGEYRLRLYGSGANPLALAGSVLAVDLGVFYPEEPVGLVDARGAPRPLAGGPIPLGTGGMELDLVLHEEPALWTPLHATLVAKDASGRAALHPDFILTVRGPAAAGYDGSGVLYTTGHRHPHDGLLHWSFTPPAPGAYLVSAYAGPTPEASGAFWQPAIASWLLRLDGPSGGLVTYPPEYRAEHHDSTSTVRSADYAEGNAFDKRYPVPVLEGAQELRADLALETMAMVQHVEGVGPSSLQLQFLDPSGKVLATSLPLAAAGATSLGTGELAAPGTYVVRVFGAGYAPLDYSGAMYGLDIAVAYATPPTARYGAEEAGQEPPPRGVAGFEPLLALAALVLAVRLRRS